jgi:pimeloyl-ACP methyl ester carboxylesterase
MISTRRIRRSAGGAAALLLALVTLSFATAAPSGATTLPVPTGAAAVAQALSNYVLSPNAVAGANDWSCKPSRAHPYPVVLVPATGVNVGTNWVTLSPMLANAGYCVYSFNYGQSVPLFPSDGLGTIVTSAKTMEAFVNRVLTKTRAGQVDLVGHSQGGMMPNYYIKFLGGATKVHTFVAIAPSNHGTTLDGIVTLGSALGILGVANGFLTAIHMPGLYEQEQGSAFQTDLFAGGTTVPGPDYWVIATDHTEVVTPYTNDFLKGATDITVQDQCPSDPVGHIGMFMDGPTLEDTLNALGGGSASFKPSCTDYGLPL